MEAEISASSHWTEVDSIGGALASPSDATLLGVRLDELRLSAQRRISMRILAPRLTRFKDPDRLT